MWMAPVILSTAALIATSLAGFRPPRTRFPRGWQARDVGPVGLNAGLQGRQGFKLVIRQVAGRWYLYSARFGIEILDVTDPWIPSS